MFFGEFLEKINELNVYDKIALYEKRGKMTYGEIIEGIYNRRKLFESLDIKAVGLWATNSIDWVTFFLESFFSNISIFVFPVKMFEREIKTYCEDYNIQILLTNNGFIYLKKVYSKNILINKVVLFSSGSTGRPKGIVLSKSALWGNASAIAKYMELTTEDKILIVKSLYHSSTISGELLLGIINGITVRIYTDSFFSRKIIETINRESISVMGGTPSIFLSMIDKVNRCKLSKIMISGSFTSPKVLDSTSEHFMCQVYHVYGLTEAGPRVTYLPPQFIKSKSASIGIPIDNVNEADEIVPDGETGELLVKSDYLMDCYLDDPILSKKKLTSKGLYTGDMGYKDQDGYLYLCGRKDDMICRSGENIWPSIIDNTILKVNGVNESLTIGIKDEYLSQRIVTILRVSKDFQKREIYAQCRKDMVQSPDDIYILDEIPKLPNGKYDKEKIKNFLKFLKVENRRCAYGINNLEK